MNNKGFTLDQIKSPLKNRYLVFLKTIQKTTGAIWQFKSTKHLKEFLTYNKKRLKSLTVYEIQKAYKDPYQFPCTYYYYQIDPKTILKGNTHAKV